MSERRLISMPSFFATLALVLFVLFVALWLNLSDIQSRLFQLAYQERVEKELGVIIGTQLVSPCQECPPEMATVVLQISPEGKAAKAGLAVGDMPVMMNGHTIFWTIGDFCWCWVNCPGDVFKIQVYNPKNGPFILRAYDPNSGKVVIQRHE